MSADKAPAPPLFPNQTMRMNLPSDVLTALISRIYLERAGRAPFASCPCDHSMFQTRFTKLACITAESTIKEDKEKVSEDVNCPEAQMLRVRVQILRGAAESLPSAYCFAQEQ